MILSKLVHLLPYLQAQFYSVHGICTLLPWQQSTELFSINSGNRVQTHFLIGNSVQTPKIVAIVYRLHFLLFQIPKILAIVYRLPNSGNSVQTPKFWLQYTDSIFYLFFDSVLTPNTDTSVLSNCRGNSRKSQFYPDICQYVECQIIIF